MVARDLQRAGHRPLILVGGSTGLIGDPKDTGERVLNSAETVAGWVERIRAQVERFVDFSGDNAARIVNNLDWTGPMSVLDFLRDIGKHFPVNRMLARDVVRNRLEEGISYTEFSYVLLQSLDYLELFRTYGCTLQFGGSDQWGNITAGVELIRRVEGARVHALATPLLTKADGTQVRQDRVGHGLARPGDDLAVRVPPVLPQRRGREGGRVPQGVQRAEPGRRSPSWPGRRGRQPHLRAAQRALADDVTALVHSPAERDAAVSPRHRRCSAVPSCRRWTRRRWPAWWPRWAAPSVGHRRRACRPWSTCWSAAGWWRAEARPVGRSPRAGRT